MKKPVLSFALIICASPVLADPTIKSPKVLTPAPTHDAKSFCYYDDKAYSEGSKLDGKSCRHRPTIDLYEKDKTVLYWEAEFNTTPAEK